MGFIVHTFGVDDYTRRYPGEYSSVVANMVYSRVCLGVFQRALTFSIDLIVVGAIIYDTALMIILAESYIAFAGICKFIEENQLDYLPPILILHILRKEVNDVLSPIVPLETEDWNHPSKKFKFSVSKHFKITNFWIRFLGVINHN